MKSKGRLYTLLSLIIVFLILLELILLVFLRIRSKKQEESSEQEPLTGQESTPPPTDYLYGLDVSEFNTVEDWNKVRQSGIRFVLVRLGGRGYGSGQLYTDEKALSYLQGAREAGLQVGAYFYSAAISVEEAILEAYYALEVLDGFPLDLPIYFDTEFSPDRSGRADGLDPELQTNLALAFCLTVESAGLGYRGGTYSNYQYLLANMEPERLNAYSLWMAHYMTPGYTPLLTDAVTDYPYPYDIWQYTSSGRIPGITGRCDLNRILLPAE